MTAGRPPGSPAGDPLPDRVEFSLRARERLRFAAGLLRAGPRGVQIADSGGFYEGVLAVLRTLEPEVHDRLRAQVDWVEGYAREEAASVLRQSV